MSTHKKFEQAINSLYLSRGRSTLNCICFRMALSLPRRRSGYRESAAGIVRRFHVSTTYQVGACPPRPRMIRA